MAAEAAGATRAKRQAARKVEGRNGRRDDRVSGLEFMIQKTDEFVKYVVGGNSSLIGLSASLANRSQLRRARTARDRLLFPWTSVPQTCIATQVHSLPRTPASCLHFAGSARGRNESVLSCEIFCSAKRE